MQASFGSTPSAPPTNQVVVLPGATPMPHPHMDMGPSMTDHFIYAAKVVSGVFALYGAYKTMNNWRNGDAAHKDHAETHNKDTKFGISDDATHIGNGSPEELAKLKALWAERNNPDVP